MISVRVNGEPRKLEEPVKIPELVARVVGTVDRSGIAVAVNRDVIRRDDWSSVQIREGDEVEIIAPFAGG